MKVFFDHCMPHRFARLLPGHTIVTADAMGWQTIENGDLLRAAAKAGFGVFLTVDVKLPRQNDIASLSIAVVLLRAHRNSLAALSPLPDRVLAVMRTIRAGEFAEVAATTPA